MISLEQTSKQFTKKSRRNKKQAKTHTENFELNRCLISLTGSSSRRNVLFFFSLMFRFPFSFVALPSFPFTSLRSRSLPLQLFQWRNESKPPPKWIRTRSGTKGVQVREFRNLECWWWLFAVLANGQPRWSVFRFIKDRKIYVGQRSNKRMVNDRYANGKLLSRRVTRATRMLPRPFPHSFPVIHSTLIESHTKEGRILEACELDSRTLVESWWETVSRPLRNDFRIFNISNFLISKLLKRERRSSSEQWRTCTQRNHSSLPPRKKRKQRRIHNGITQTWQTLNWRTPFFSRFKTARQQIMESTSMAVGCGTEVKG